MHAAGARVQLARLAVGLLVPTHAALDANVRHLGTGRGDGNVNP